jgi:hypothetical protein
MLNIFFFPYLIITISPAGRTTNTPVPEKRASSTFSAPDADEPQVPPVHCRPSIVIPATGCATPSPSAILPASERANATFRVNVSEREIERYSKSSRRE